MYFTAICNNKMDEIVDKLACLQCDNRIETGQLSSHLIECLPKINLFACNFCCRGFSCREYYFEHKCDEFTKFNFDSRFGSEELEFLWTYTLVVCTGCGIQLNIETLKNEYFQDAIKPFLDDYQNLTFAHNSKKFVICTVHMTNEINFDSIKLVFSSQILQLSTVSPNNLLPIYLDEIYKIQQKDSGGSYRNESLVELEKLKVNQNKKFRVENYFNTLVVSPTQIYYVCKKCGHKSRPNVHTSSLIQHMRDNHIEMVGNMRFLNAQSQFDIIMLENGNKRFQCKVCNHLTKVNVKASALSQHFYDKHSDLRWQAVRKYITKHMDQKNKTSSTTTTTTTTKAMHNLNDSYFIDKDPSELMEFSDIQLIKCETSMRVQFPTTSLFYPQTMNEFLDDDVYKCQLCSTLISTEELTKKHFDRLHKTLDYPMFDLKNHTTKLFSFLDFPISMIPCFVCNSKHCTILSLRLHLKSAHQTDFMLESHPKHIEQIGQNVRGLIFQEINDPKNLSIDQKSGADLQNINNGNVVDNVNDGSRLFDEIKMENVLSEIDLFSKNLLNSTTKTTITTTNNNNNNNNNNIINNNNNDQTETEASIMNLLTNGNSSSLKNFNHNDDGLIVDDDEIDESNRISKFDDDEQTQMDTNSSENGLINEALGQLNNITQQQQQPSTSISNNNNNTNEIAQQQQQQQKSSLKIKRRNSSNTRFSLTNDFLFKNNHNNNNNNTTNRPYKNLRFNAQEQFEILDCSDGTRYRCLFCGHTTKPNVSTTTLSQHFYDRHPEMRAKIKQIKKGGENCCLLRTSLTTTENSLNKKLIADLNNKSAEEMMAQICYNSENCLITPQITQSGSITEDILALSQLNNNNNTNNINNNNDNFINDSISSNNTFDQNGGEFLNLWKSDDDIVFGRFFETNSLEEFERLERSQNTVFPYFEIAIKNDPEISSRLICCLSKMLSAQDKTRLEIFERVKHFFCEVLKRSHKNELRPMKLIGEILEKGPEYQCSMNIASIFRIVDEIFKSNNL